MSLNVHENDNHAVFDTAGVQAFNNHDYALADGLWRKALLVDSRFYDTYYKVALANFHLNLFLQAKHFCMQGLILEPGMANVNTYQLLAKTYLNLNLINEYISTTQHILDQSEGEEITAVYLSEYANTLHCLRRYAEADSMYEKALALFTEEKTEDPTDQNSAHGNIQALILVNRAANYEAMADYLKCAETYSDVAQINPHLGLAYSFAAYWFRQEGQWARAEEIEKRAISTLLNNQVIGILPFPMTVSPLFDAASLQKAAQLFVQNISIPAPLTVQGRDFKRNTPARLHIGYLSSDFREHAVAHVIAGVLESHDRDKVLVSLYSYGPDQDTAMRNRLKKAAHRFVDIHALSDAQAAQRIAHDDVHILVDLMGHTAGVRLGILAHRPAPVIMTWLGYPGTLGSNKLVDYIISDDTVTPQHHAAYYDERLAILPHCYQPNDNTQTIGDMPSRYDLGLPENAIVFCSFNQAFKITEDIFTVWCRLLQAVPDSVLWLKDIGKTAIAQYRLHAQHKGVAPHRLIFASNIDLENHLGRLQQADIYLDTAPYNGHATASNALWAGLPMVAIMGETFAGRVGASLLTALHMPELITHSLDEYYELAYTLATQTDKRLSIRKKIADHRLTTPLFNTQDMTQDLENLYQKIWDEKIAS